MVSMVFSMVFHWFSMVFEISRVMLNNSLEVEWWSRQISSLRHLLREAWLFRDG